METQHTKDSDCTVDQATDLCSICGVFHGEACPQCGGKGFHQESCPDSDGFVAAATKGPWNIHHAYPLEAKLYRVMDSRGIEYFTSWSTRIAAGEKLIALVEMQKMDDPARGGFAAVEDIEEARANARLIAAAWEMRESLELAVKAMDSCRSALLRYGGGDMPTLDRIIDNARAALAKASGKCA